VLRLRQQVGGHPFGPSRAIGDDQDLARSCEVVDPDPPEHQPLRGLHVEVPWTDDLVHARQRLRAEGERRHRLRAADAKEAVDAGDRRRGENRAVASLQRSRRRYGDDLPDAGHLGRDDVHQHRRRIGRAPTRHVDADALERLDLLAEHEPRAIAVAPAPLQLAAMEVPDAACREAQRAPRRLVDRPFRASELRPRDFHAAAHVDTVEAARGGDEGSIALLPHSLHDDADRALDVAVARVPPLGERLEATPKARPTGALNVDGSLHPVGAFSRRMSAPRPRSFSSIRS
jgi:hypothetical protein